MKVVKLIEQLVSIPSYVRGGTNEKEVGDFIFTYLKKFPYLKIKKQEVEGGRFNIIVETKGESKLFLAGHLDTVEPKISPGQYGVNLRGNKLFGLGALDTKSGVAAMMNSLNDFKHISGLTLLFYCDEEYDFKGMRKFINSRKKRVGDLAVFSEPSDLKIWNAHRGLIEICFSVQGKTGHAGYQESGNNAIDGTIEAINYLRSQLSKLTDKTLGAPSLNIAYIRGGLNIGKDVKDKIILGNQGNNIADFAEAVLDIRPTKVSLNAKVIIKYLEKYLIKNNYRLSNFSIRHDLGSFFTDRKQLKEIEGVMRTIMGRVDYLNPTYKGYGDGQLFQERFKIPVVYIGPKGANAHGVDEWVDVSSVEKLKEVYSAIIRKYCS